MFYKYQSHSLDKLAKVFSDKIKGAGDPLQPTWVVVQNNEVKEWLSLVCAKETGIAANFKFIFPSEFLWTLYRLQEKEVSSNLPSDRNALHWSLFQLFIDQPDVLEHIPIISSVEVDPRRIFQFSGQLADVFDQYQVYRPEMMENWLVDQFSSTSKEEKWQAEVWRLLNKRWDSSPATKNIPRRSETFTRLLKWLDEDEFIHKLPSKLFVFGLPQLSNPFLEIISSIASKIDLHFFTGNFPDVDDSLKEIAQKWSKSRSEQLNLLDEFINSKEVDEQTHSLDSEHYQLPNIEVHSCHNERREVEVLKDQVLTFLDENPQYNTDDILILVPDAESYGGLLESIFNTANNEPILPISRINKKNKQSASHALTLIINLLSGSFKANDVMQVLNLKPVKSHFEFSDSDIENIEKWVLDNRIFWGLGEKPDSLYSWRKGVNQLMAGFAMEAPELGMYNGLAPYEGIVSSDQLECAAKFSSFIHVLKSAAKKVQKKQKPVEWIEFLGELIDKFIIEDDAKSQQKQRLHQLKTKLGEQVSFAEVETSIEYELIKPWLLSQLEKESSSSGRFGQGITVSTFIPYRAVPFKFIAMLGMNEGAFPRSSVRPDYDLISRHPIAGDRVLKEDDSQLFWETVIAAQSHLHLSFKGKEQNSDQKKLPSILIQQLLEILPDESNLLKEHALHPFSKSYFIEKNLNTYSEQNASIAKQLTSAIKDDQPFVDDSFAGKSRDSEVIELRDFISFFTHPVKQFAQKYLDIKSYNDLKLLEDREVFKLNGLKNYQFHQFLFENLADKREEESLYTFASSMAFIPEGVAGKKVFESEKTNISTLLNLLLDHKVEEEQTIDIAIKIKGIEIRGSVDGVCGNKLISHRAAKLKGKYLIEHWLKHLLLIHSGVDIEQSVYFSETKSKNKSVDIISIDSEQLPEGVLEDYLSWYLDESAILNKLAFFPDSSKAYAECIQNGKSEEKAMSSANSKWDGWNGGEVEDKYNMMVWRGREPLETDAFKENAVRFWKPLLSIVKEDSI